MKIIDRFILNNFIVKLIWAFFAAVLIFLVVDMVEQLDNFIDSRAGWSVVLRYYGLYIPYIVYLTLPVATLLATLFTIGGMTNSNELIALKVSGVPFRRVVFLLVVIATLCAAVGFIIGESVVPAANRRRMDIYRYEVKKLPLESRARMGKLYFEVTSGEHLYIDHYRAKTREAFGVEVIHYQDGGVDWRLDAEKLVWLNGRWHAQGATRKTFSPDGRVSIAREVKYYIDKPGLRPDDFEKIQTKPEEMNWPELKEFIARLKSTGGLTLRWEVELLSKVTLPAAAIIIILFGAPVAAVKRRSGTMIGFGISLLICFVYFGFIQVGKVMGYSGMLPPWLAAWVGNIFFGMLGLTALASARS